MRRVIGIKKDDNDRQWVTGGISLHLIWKVEGSATSGRLMQDQRSVQRGEEEDERDQKGFKKGKCWWNNGKRVKNVNSSSSTANSDQQSKCRSITKLHIITYMISGKTIAKQREGKKQLRKPKTSRAQRSGKDGQWITVGISLHFKNRHGVNRRKGEINGESSRILESEWI